MKCTIVAIFLLPTLVLAKGLLSSSRELLSIEGPVETSFELDIDEDSLNTFQINLLTLRSRLKKRNRSYQIDHESVYQSLEYILNRAKKDDRDGYSDALKFVVYLKELLELRINRHDFLINREEPYPQINPIKNLVVNSNDAFQRDFLLQTIRNSSIINSKNTEKLKELSENSYDLLSRGLLPINFTLQMSSKKLQAKLGETWAKYLSQEDHVFNISEMLKYLKLYTESTHITKDIFKTFIKTLFKHNRRPSFYLDNLDILYKFLSKYSKSHRLKLFTIHNANYPFNLNLSLSRVPLISSHKFSAYIALVKDVAKNYVSPQLTFSLLSFLLTSPNSKNLIDNFRIYIDLSSKVMGVEKMHAPQISMLHLNFTHRMISSWGMKKLEDIFPRTLQHLSYYPYSTKNKNRIKNVNSIAEFLKLIVKDPEKYARMTFIDPIIKKIESVPLEKRESMLMDVHDTIDIHHYLYIHFLKNRESPVLRKILAFFFEETSDNDQEKVAFGKKLLTSLVKLRPRYQELFHTFLKYTLLPVITEESPEKENKLIKIESLFNPKKTVALNDILRITARMKDEKNFDHFFELFNNVLFSEVYNESLIRNISYYASQDIMTTLKALVDTINNKDHAKDYPTIPLLAEDDSAIPMLTLFRRYNNQEQKLKFLVEKSSYKDVIGKLYPSLPNHLFRQIVRSTEEIMSKIHLPDTFKTNDKLKNQLAFIVVSSLIIKNGEQDDLVPFFNQFLKDLHSHRLENTMPSLKYLIGPHFLRQGPEIYFQFFKRLSELTRHEIDKTKLHARVLHLVSKIPPEDIVSLNSIEEANKWKAQLIQIILQNLNKFNYYDPIPSISFQSMKEESKNNFLPVAYFIIYNSNLLLDDEDQRNEMFHHLDLAIETTSHAGAIRVLSVLSNHFLDNHRSLLPEKLIDKFEIDLRHIKNGSISGYYRDLFKSHATSYPQREYSPKKGKHCLNNALLKSTYLSTFLKNSSMPSNKDTSGLNSWFLKTITELSNKVRPQYQSFESQKEDDPACQLSYQKLAPIMNSLDSSTWKNLMHSPKVHLVNQWKSILSWWKSIPQGDVPSKLVYGLSSIKNRDEKILSFLEIASSCKSEKYQILDSYIHQVVPSEFHNCQAASINPQHFYPLSELNKLKELSESEHIEERIGKDSYRQKVLPSVLSLYQDTLRSFLSSASPHFLDLRKAILKELPKQHSEIDQPHHDSIYLQNTFGVEYGLYQYKWDPIFVYNVRPELMSQHFMSSRVRQVFTKHFPMDQFIENVRLFLEKDQQSDNPKLSFMELSYLTSPEEGQNTQFIDYETKKIPQQTAINFLWRLNILTSCQENTPQRYFENID